MKIFARLAFVLAVAVVCGSCEQDVIKSNVFEFSGKSFVYWQGEFDDDGVCRSGECVVCEFDENGGLSVYGKVVKEVEEVLREIEFSTDGKSLYYNFDGARITIYRGKKGWSKDERDEVCASGSYYSGCLMLSRELLKMFGDEALSNESIVLVRDLYVDAEWRRFVNTPQLRNNN